MSPAAAVRGAGGRGFTEQTILICAMIGAAQMTWGVVVPILPLFVEQFGVAATALGPVIAAFAIGRIIANVPAGVALRWWRPRPYLFAVMLGLAAVTAVTGFAQDLTAVFILRVIAGVLGGAAVTIGFAVLVAGAPAERRGSAMATATVVQMSAGAVGSVLGGAVITVASGAAVFAVAVIPLVAVLMWDVVRPARLYWEAWARAGTESSTHADSTGDADTSPRPAWRELLGDGRAVLLVGLLVVSFATFLARFAGEQGMVPVLAYDSGGLTPLTLGIAMACGTVASFAVLPLVGRWADRGARLRILVPSGVAAAAGIVVFPLAGGPWEFGAVVVLYSVATSVANVVPGVVTGERFPARLTGTVIGLTRTAGDLGAVVGPLLVFAVAAAWGPVQAMVLIAVVLLVSVIIFVPAYRRRTRPATSDS